MTTWCQIKQISQLGTFLGTKRFDYRAQRGSFHNEKGINSSKVSKKSQCVWTYRASNYMKPNLRELKGSRSTVLVADFDNHLKKRQK